MRAIFAVFLCACAWKDLRDKEIPLIFLGIPAAAGVIWITGEIGIEIGSGEPLFKTLSEQALSLLPGTGLLIISHCTAGAIGKGDGLFFLVAGAYLGFWKCLALLFCGLLFCSAWGLGMLLCGFCTERRGKDIRLPFLPFLIPAAVLLQIFIPSGLI